MFGSSEGLVKKTSELSEKKRAEKEYYQKMLELEDDDSGYDLIKEKPEHHKLKIKMLKTSSTQEFPVVRLELEIENLEPVQMYNLFDDEMIMRQMEWNKHCKFIKKFETEAGFTVFWSAIKCPVISDREFIDKRFQFHDPKTGLYGVLFTTATDDPTVKEKCPVDPKLVRATNFFNYYILRPLPDGRSGTKYTQVSSSDFGGSIPKFLVNSIGPKSLAEFADTIIEYARDL